MKRIVEEINRIVRIWFEFEIINYSKKSLEIRGGLDIFDINSPYEFSIIFSDIFYLSSLITWQTDTSKNFLRLIKGKEFLEINQKFKIEQGYLVFEFLVEDYEDNKFIVVAKKIEYTIPMGTASILNNQI